MIQFEGLVRVYMLMGVELDERGGGYGGSGGGRGSDWAEHFSSGV